MRSNGQIGAEFDQNYKPRDESVKAAEFAAGVILYPEKKEDELNMNSSKLKKEETPMKQIRETPDQADIWAPKETPKETEPVNDVQPEENGNFERFELKKTNSVTPDLTPENLYEAARTLKTKKEIAACFGFKFPASLHNHLIKNTELREAYETGRAEAGKLRQAPSTPTKRPGDI